jgi:DNA-binding beta-propeller fold protein YncE
MLNRRELLKLSGQGLLALGAAQAGCITLPWAASSTRLSRIAGIGEDFLVFGADGAVYRILSSLHLVQKLDPSGAVAWEIGDLGEEHGDLNFPTDVEITSEGHLLVVDTGNHRIERYDSEGNHLSTFGAHTDGVDAAELDNPGSVVLGRDGRVYVCDAKDHHIHVYTEQSELVDTFGEFGTALEQLNHPQAMEMDAAGHLHVIDRGNNRIQVFDREGNLVRSYGSFGEGEGGLRTPRDLLIDSDGNSYVADSADCALDVFGPDGEPLAIVPLTFDDLRPCSPRRLSWTADGEIYVAGTPVELRAMS